MIFDLFIGDLQFHFGAFLFMSLVVAIQGFGVFGVIYGWDTFITEDEWKQIKKHKEEDKERRMKKREEKWRKEHYYEDHWSEPEVKIEHEVRSTSPQNETDDYYMEKWGKSYYQDDKF